MTVPGAEPFLMTQAIIGNQGGCDAPVPILTSALSGQKQVTLSWSDEHSADPGIIGYGIYYDQAGKAQFVDQVGLTATYIDTDKSFHFDSSICSTKASTLVMVCSSEKHLKSFRSPLMTRYGIPSLFAR